jgi:hypothetical protein
MTKVASILTLLTACVAAPGDEPPVEESVADESATADEVASEHTSVSVPKASGFREYHVSSGPHDDKTYMGDEDIDHSMCVLSRVSGNLSDDGGGLSLYWGQGLSDGWVLYARSNDDSKEVYASALCVDHDNFARPKGSVVWTSDSFGTGGEPSGNDNYNKKLWWGDSFSYLTSIEGEFEGTGEYARVDQSSKPSSSSTLNVATEAGWLFDATNIYARAHSFFVGVPNSPRLVKLMGHNDGVRRGDVTSSGTFRFDVGTVSGHSTYWMTPTDASICGLTKVSGDFDGGGESVKITASSNYWVLSAKAGSGRSAYASARCMAFNQK